MQLSQTITSKPKRSRYSKTLDIVVPPLKWVGGKRWLTPHIKPYWKRYSSHRFIEPFCGGLAVTLGLQPERAILNDINKPLIHFFNQLKKGLLVSHKFKNTESFYYQKRNRFNKLLEKKLFHPETAELFYYLNRTGYNGLCRFNNKGQFNVPFGRHKQINYKKDDNFLIYKKIFKPWRFTCLDFEKIKLQKTDFIYADPPYDVQFTKYSPENFSWEDQERLAYFLAQHKGPVIISNQATKRINWLYKKLGFKLKFLQAPRRISCTGNRFPAKEVLAFKNF